MPAGELPPPAGAAAALGPPTLRFGPHAAGAAVWLVRTDDAIGLYAAIADSTPSWNDELVVLLDVAGDRAPSPRHDDFQWQLRRVLDSSVVARGRAGRWEPPRSDPDWRLGAERSGGGWEVSAAETANGWAVLLRLHPAWLAAESGRPAGLVLRVYDGGPGGWYAWPAEPAGAHPTAVERAPVLWSPVTDVRARSEAPR